MDEHRKISLSRKSIKGNEIIDYVHLETIPKFTLLVDQVDKIVAESSWWDMYGVDWTIIFLGAIGYFLSFWILNSESYLRLVFGVVLLGCCHTILSTKGGHSATHGAVVSSPKWNKVWATVFLECVGSFSEELGNDMHIKSHHPHTNIIGQGDSSTWRVPFLPAYVYMFIAPLTFPILTPFVALSGLFGKWTKLCRCFVHMSLGLVINYWLLINISGFSLWGAVVIIFASRGTLSIPYIHVNIFQHIGLPMYSQENRPKKIYQMSTGVLNLDRNTILDSCFGHSIISCHVEHHLFPRLSDNMCLKIKPLVSTFLKVNGLPYNEATYFSRMMYFVEQYQELMVKSPPITHFVGIQ